MMTGDHFAVFYCEKQHYASMLDFSPDRRKNKTCSVNHSLPYIYWGKERKTSCYMPMSCTQMVGNGGKHDLGNHVTLLSLLLLRVFGYLLFPSAITRSCYASLKYARQLHSAVAAVSGLATPSYFRRPRLALLLAITRSNHTSLSPTFAPVVIPSRRPRLMLRFPMP